MAEVIAAGVLLLLAANVLVVENRLEKL